MKNIRLLFFYIILTTLLLLFISCDNAYNVQLIDADGTIIKTVDISSAEFDVDRFPLPEDTENWHYTKWIKAEAGDGFILKAERVKKTKIVWKNYDGTVIEETSIIDGEDVPTKQLPSGDEKWSYTEWESSEEDGAKIFTALKVPNVNYFIGNVFQIVVNDSDGNPLGVGSGFVINDEGWFVTNDHVMNGASSATAYFDIKNTSTGNKYTQLNIIGGVYNNSEKDIFIGKLEGYEKIKKHYNEFDFTEQYETGEISYTVGYPNSSVKIEINSGKILEEYSDIYDKINGIYYVLSDSYIAPGSSGGILINEKFEIIGITTIGLYADNNKQIYQAGGSVPTFVFISLFKNLYESNLKNLDDIYKNKLF